MFDAHDAVIPLGSPVGEPIPVAFVVLRVILVIVAFKQTGAEEEAAPTVTTQRFNATNTPLFRWLALKVAVPAPVAPAVAFSAQAAPTDELVL